MTCRPLRKISPSICSQSPSANPRMCWALLCARERSFDNSNGCWQMFPVLAAAGEQSSEKRLIAGKSCSSIRTAREGRREEHTPGAKNSRCKSPEAESLAAGGDKDPSTRRRRWKCRGACSKGRVPFLTGTFLANLRHWFSPKGGQEHWRGSQRVMESDSVCGGHLWPCLEPGAVQMQMWESR